MLMLKKVLTFFITLILVMFLLQIKIYAASIPLGSVTVDTSKTKVAPGEEVKVTINFGTELGAYTFDVAYDNSIFEYVSSEGGTENDNGTRVRVTYYDSSGGTNPRSNMSVTFRAKADLTTTNPTNFSITAEGLANSDASQEYDDITTAIEKEVTVEPRYEDYKLDLNYSGKIVDNEAKEFKLLTTSSMGRNYDNVMLKAEVIEKPENANIKLTALDDTSQEVDVLKDGWGSTKGYSLGGKDVKNELILTGTFDKIDEYKIKFSVLDKDNSNQVIVQKEFNISVADKDAVENENDKPENNEENNNQTTVGNNDNSTNSSNKKEENLPKELPKTGMPQYAYIATIMSVLVCGYIITKNYKKQK